VRLAGAIKSRTEGEFSLRNPLLFAFSELKPRGEWLTPFNIISIPVILLGIVLIGIRFAKGLGSITNLSQEVPWGLWIGFDVVTGVAFAGGAYVLTFMVYILRLEKYHSLVRVTVLNGFLAYVFYAGALLLDLGRPWNVINPIIGNSFGVSSVLFLVAWHFLLYMIAELLEFSPVIAEWLGLRRMRKILSGMTLGAVVFGITLSTLHQSGLGALYLMAREKLHPLWYSEFIPILFFVSSIFAGLSLVIFEGSITHRVFADRISDEDRKSHNTLLFDIARICAGTMFVYFFLQALLFIHEKRIAYLDSPMGYWYLTELLGFVLAPCILFILGMKRRSPIVVRIAAVMTMIGIVLNRLNVSVIAFKWYAPVRYVPTWMEIEVTLAIIFAEISAFRWFVSRMPVLDKPPAWAIEQDAQALKT
jgi:Ni/Fe-hydrogenase subunit HybB-like protein